MDAFLKQKNAIVTGGASGIGKEIAILYAKNGANVAVLDMNEEKGLETLLELSNNKIFEDQNFYFEKVNVADKANIELTLTKILENWGKVDILVNNAGITRDNLLMRMSEKDWDDVIDVNLKSVYNTCSSLIRSMIRAKFGKIINISSVVGLIGNPGQTNYAASKSAVIGFTKALAQEVASKNICVNCIAPGFIDTPMTQKLTENQRELLLKDIPMGMIGKPKNVADVALFLASDLSSYITGQVITVDGGMVM